MVKKIKLLRYFPTDGAISDQPLEMGSNTGAKSLERDLHLKTSRFISIYIHLVLEIG